MAQQTLNAPASPYQGPPTRDTTEEAGDSWKSVLTKLAAMFTELYTSAAVLAGLVAQVGTTVVDFGAFPGALDTYTTVTGQTAILASSNVQAWLEATETADHSVDEHWADPPRITVGSIVAGVGFTIYAISRDGNPNYGQWTVQWKWQ